MVLIGYCNTNVMRPNAMSQDASELEHNIETISADAIIAVVASSSPKPHKQCQKQRQLPLMKV